MREKYIDLMERALLAYSDEHIQRYFDEVRQVGLSEHGFPRLTSNIGILIAHGRCTDKLPIFLEMMEYCCKTIPRVKAANDFSVREIICCIKELETSGAVDVSTTKRWREYLTEIDPYTCYNVIARTPEDKVKNWALFSAVSEYYRQEMGLCHSEQFIDIQLATQLSWLDDFGMYMDGEGEQGHPIVYDAVPRGLFALLLHRGYRGRYFEQIDDCLRRTGLMTLKMQSPNGELAYGGRSNQFIHNEAWLAAILEYEASRYAKEGDLAMAGQFKAAVSRAVSVAEHWLSLDPIYHIKNRYPTETKQGCEKYAYFDKYMITAASFLYAAYLMCDDSIPTPADMSDVSPCTFATTWRFHKLFVKAGGYGIELDTFADPHYDASGVGRVHKAGAPSTVCMSVPCPADPIYTVSLDNPAAISLCPGVLSGGEWLFATGRDTRYEVISLDEGEVSARAVLRTTFASGEEIMTEYTVDGDGVKIKVRGDGKLAFMLPAFTFDGEKSTDISLGNGELSVTYAGWSCHYKADGEIFETPYLGSNRNGSYKAYAASGARELNISIVISEN